MSSRRVYLDWNATAPLRPEAREAMVSALDVLGNPSSVHAEGRKARALVEAAREKVAALVGARPGEVFFTSGATEANAIVLAGRRWARFVSSPMEHASVTEPGGATDVVEIAAGDDGRSVIDTALSARVAAPVGSAAFPGPVLVSHHLVNGETGVVQDIAGLVSVCRAVRPEAVIHTDAAQAVGRMPVDFHGLGVDALTLSGHKLGGPKGVGALVLKDGIELAPLARGGGQERRLRPGTENVAAIAGLGAAAAAARAALAAEAGRVGDLRARLEAGVKERTPEAVVIGERSPRVTNTSCIALPGRTAELLVIALDLAGIAVSAGAACSSGKVATSRTLGAMGLPGEVAQAAIRVSLGPATTEHDIAAFLAAWSNLAATSRRAA